MTIYDIAELAGVSASSVSRVINGKPGVNKAKREEIERLLREHNYMPDVNARSLVMQATHTIGILTDDLVSTRHKESISRVETEMMRQGYYCIVKYLPQGEGSMEISMQELARHHLEGVVCFGPSFRDNDRVKAAVKQFLPQTPIVLVNHMGGVHLGNVYSVGANEKEGFTRCVELLVARGRKNIALMVDLNRVSAAVIREGFEKGIRKAQGVRGLVYMDVQPTLEGGAEKICQILREHPQLDGLICANDLMAIGAMNKLQDIGVAVPRDISIIGEDNSLYCEVCRPRLSSLDTMLNSLTMMAVRTLCDVLEGREASHSIVLSFDIVERDTTRKRAEA